MNPEFILKDVFINNNIPIIKDYTYNQSNKECSFLYSYFDSDLFEDFIKNINIQNSKIIFSNRDKCTEYIDYIIILLSEELQLCIKKTSNNSGSLFLKYKNETFNMGRRNTYFSFSNIDNFFNFIKNQTLLGIRRNKNYHILEYKLEKLLLFLKETNMSNDYLYEIYFE